VTLWLFDGKLVELAPWLDCAKRFVAPILSWLSRSSKSPGRDGRALRDLLAHKAARSLPVTARAACGSHRRTGLYVAGVDKKLASRFSELLRDLVARGRAAGSLC